MKLKNKKNKGIKILKIERKPLIITTPIINEPAIDNKENKEKDKELENKK